MKKITFVLLMITSILFLGLGLTTSPLMANTTNDSYKEKEVYLNIITTSKVQYNMIKAIVGDKHNIQYLTNCEKEVKEFKANENLISNIANMDLFIYNGFGYELWIDDLITSIKSGNVGIINIGRGIRPISTEIIKETKENPYYFLGVNDYKVALYNIKSSIQDKDIKNRQFYEQNYEVEAQKFNLLLEESKKSIEKFNDTVVLTSNDYFDYLLKDLDIKPFKVKDGQIKKVINDNNLKGKKIVYIKNKDEDVSVLKDSISDKKSYSVIELTRENNTISSYDLLKENLSQIVKNIENINKIN